MKADLYFGGSMWLNLDLALRRMDFLFRQEAGALNLTIAEWYIMRALYQQDGQKVGQLACAIGRASTAFTPIIDSMVRKGLVIRQPHSADRRIVFINLTPKGKSYEAKIRAGAERIEGKIPTLFSDKQWQSYQRVIEAYQTVDLPADLSRS